MKTKKTRRRFDTPQAIYDEIDKSKTKAVGLIRQAEVLEAEAKEIASRNNPNNAELIGFKREQAKKLRAQYGRIMNKRLPYLSQKLAELNTNPMPGIISDRSVER
jgi:hypothetical protein